MVISISDLFFVKSDRLLGEHGQQRGRGDDGITAAIGTADLEAVARVPGEMPNPVAQVVEVRRSTSPTTAATRSAKR